MNYQDYEHGFSYDLLKDFEEGQLDGFNTKTTQDLIYGYTFAENYKKGSIPDTLSMDYWSDQDDGLEQELMILDAMLSTGDGSSATPFCVICVAHEYELLRRIYPRSKVMGQRLLPGHIDCIDIEYKGQPLSVYFDISRWFERNKESC